jgi:hypothetical protein
LPPGPCPYPWQLQWSAVAACLRTSRAPKGAVSCSSACFHVWRAAADFVFELAAASCAMPKSKSKGPARPSRRADAAPAEDEDDMDADAPLPPAAERRRGRSRTVEPVAGPSRLRQPPPPRIGGPALTGPTDGKRRRKRPRRADSSPDEDREQYCSACKQHRPRYDFVADGRERSTCHDCRAAGVKRRLERRAAVRALAAQMRRLHEEFGAVPRPRYADAGRQRGGRGGRRRCRRRAPAHAVT